MIFGLFGKKKEEEGVLVGEVIHFFPHVQAAVIEVKKGNSSIDDSIRIKGNTTDLKEMRDVVQEFLK